MTGDLESRLAQLQERRQAGREAAEAELARLKLELSSHAEDIRSALAAEARRINQLMIGVDDQARDAADAIGQMRQHEEAITKALSANDLVLRRQARWAWLAVGGACLAAMLIVVLASWAASDLIDAAGLEADAIRAANVEELVAAREEGQTAIADLHEQLAIQRMEVERRIDEVGVELASMSNERDAVQAELDRFIELRDRLGFSLVEGRSRILIVVPEGHEIHEWRGPRPSDTSRYNGRMYRVMAER